MEEKIVSSDAALAMPIPPKIRPHSCANSKPFSQKNKQFYFSEVKDLHIPNIFCIFAENLEQL